MIRQIKKEHEFKLIGYYCKKFMKLRFLYIFIKKFVISFYRYFTSLYKYNKKKNYPQFKKNVVIIGSGKSIDNINLNKIENNTVILLNNSCKFTIALIKIMNFFMVQDMILSLDTNIIYLLI